MHALLTLRVHNLCGNILTGLSAFALGLAWLLDGTGRCVPIAAFALLFFSGVSFALCLARQHEMPDEMAYAHEGASSSFALKALLLSCALLCCLDAISPHVVPLAPACCLCIGFGLVAYGISFARLERDE